jgi:hypothetical protein
MKRVSYAGQSFLTADAVADALVDLTAAISRGRRAEIVEVPIIDESGRIQPARLVLDPFSHIMAIRVESQYQEPELNDVASQFRLRARMERSRHIATPTPAELTAFGFDEVE